MMKWIELDRSTFRLGFAKSTLSVALKFKKETAPLNEKEKPALEKAADTVNDVVEEIALKVADASIEPDPEHVAGSSNEQLYLPEASPTGAAQNPSVNATVPPSPVEKPANKEKATK
jgi:hypothetical protein